MKPNNDHITDGDKHEQSHHKQTVLVKMRNQKVAFHTDVAAEGEASKWRPMSAKPIDGQRRTSKLG